MSCDFLRFYFFESIFWVIMVVLYNDGTVRGDGYGRSCGVGCKSLLSHWGLKSKASCHAARQASGVRGYLCCYGHSRFLLWICGNIRPH